MVGIVAVLFATVMVQLKPRTAIHPTLAG
jgi:hypothetical protein